MAAKRYLDDDCKGDENQLKQKKKLHNVIREVVMRNFLNNMCSSLEPMLRRVVSEEVENGLKRRRYLESTSIPMSSSCPSLRIEMPPPDLKLTFRNPLSLPIFTGTKIVGIDNQPLQIMLTETDTNNNNGEVSMSFLPLINHCVKVEILVLDGDFCSGRSSETETWTEEEFAKNIVKERAGKRPLLTGEVLVNLRGGVGVVGDIEFTDNSSWIRSRKFRIGVRVVQTQGKSVRIREAVTEPFVVKDHRGELYKKHHPPALEDEVWRLEKIGKGGVIHQKLASEGINTVQDFLKLSNIDSSKLRKIMGIGLAEKMWEAILKHAKSCELGTKLYRSHGNHYILTLNPICQVTRIEIEGQVYLEGDFKKMNTAYMESLVRDAYLKWDSLEEVDAQIHHNTQLQLTNGEIMMGNEQTMFMRSYMGEAGLADGSLEVDPVPNNQHTDYSDQWAIDSGFYINTHEGG